MRRPGHALLLPRDLGSPGFGRLPGLLFECGEPSQLWKNPPSLLPSHRHAGQHEYLFSLPSHCNHANGETQLSGSTNAT